jgi:peroxiredoxin
VRIVAVGLADPDATAAWAESLEYTYEIWSDPGRALIDGYGASIAWDTSPLRHAFVLDAEGRAIVRHDGAVSLGADPRAVLADCATLFGN